MNLLLKPGVSLIGRLAFARKFQILSVVFLIPIAYGAFVLCSGYRDRLGAVDRERSGVAMLSALNEAQQTGVFLRNEASHWKAVDIAAAPQDSRQAALEGWLSSQQRYEAALTKNQSLGYPEVAHRKFVEAVKTNYGRQKTASTDPQSLASWWPDAYNIAISQAQELNNFSALIVRQHKLNLDPWPETYELMTLATRTLPELLEVAGSMNGIGQGVIASRGFSLLSRAQLRETSAKAKSLVSSAGMPDFPLESGPELAEWLEKYRAALQAVVTHLASVDNDFFKSKSVPADGAAFADELLGLQANIIQLQQSVLGALDTQLSIYQREAKQSFVVTLTAFAALILVAIYILLCVQFSIRRSASGITSFADSLRDGDLRESVVPYGRDELTEIGTSLNAAVQQLRSSFMNINDRTGELNFTVADLIRESDSSLRAAESQQIQVSLIASAATEMASTAADVARNCEQASQQAQAADTVAKKGTQQSRITIDSIRGLTANLDNAVGNLEALQEQARQIDDVVTVIKTIADQTNLLALNAAIEAARAGEHGRGFAVVADEVRSLSTRTKESTQVISDTVVGLQKVVRNSVEGMQAACAQARTDVTAVIGLNDHLESISQAVERVTGMIYQIAAAAEQQSATADEVSGNIQQIDEMTTLLLSGAGQVKSASDQLSHSSQQLSGYTAAFKL